MRVIVLLFFVLITNITFSQEYYKDSLQAELKKEKKDTSRAMILYNLSYEYLLIKPDTALMLAKQAYDISLRRKFLKGEAGALNQMGNAFREMGNNAEAINYYLEQLKIEEQLNRPENLAMVNMTIALAYNQDRDANNAIYYIQKADSIINKNNLSDFKAFSLLNAGDIYEKANRLKEATDATQQAYNLAVLTKEILVIGTALSNFGNIHLKQHLWKEAILQYKLSIPYLKEANDLRTISEAELGLANAFYNNRQKDSALYYAKESFRVAAGNGFLRNALQSSNLLSTLYKNYNNIDSAFRYLETTLLLKDSIESSEKVKKLESLTIAEKIRQEQLRELAKIEKKERRQKLELLAIGIAIPMLFLISLYISRKKITKRVVEFAGIFSLLFFFEYLTLFIHPFVQEIAHHSPLVEIFIFVAIAALMIPAHHKIEHWFTRRLVHIHEKHITLNKTAD